MYLRLCETLSKYKLIDENENIWDHISNPNKDYYVSIYKYNDDQYKKWLMTKTVSGIKNVITNKLIFDFDCKEDINKAKLDAIELCNRLVKKGINPEQIQISFSGLKGYMVELNTDKTFNVDEFKSVTKTLADGLSTFDTTVSDAQRVVRVIGTKHPKSGLYKYPLTFDELKSLSVNDIKHMATDIDKVDTSKFKKWEEPIKFPTIETKAIEVPFKGATALVDGELDLTNKPRWISPAKYALQEGFFPTGEGKRHTVFMILAATYRAQGFNKDTVYRMLKGVAEVQARRSQTERFPDDELWNSVIESVFSPTWQGGQYGPDHPILVETTKKYNLPEKDYDQVLINSNNISNVFKSFAENIDKNTMKLGIDAIDDNVRITTSMVVGLLGAPSSGKTALSINFLNYASKNNVKSLFFSLDMGAPLVFQRLIQRHKGITSDKVFEIYKNKDEKAITEIENEIGNNYKNVNFCFKTGLTIDDLRDTIIKEQTDSGEKVKLVVVDYLECISGPYSDATANTALVAQKLKDIANDLELTVIVLLQPQKHAGDPSDELLTYRNIKGSSAIEQAASIVMSVWRPGFSAKQPHNDKYMSIAVLKNRMGGLSQHDFKWDGLTGTVRNLEYEEKADLKSIRENKAAEKQSLSEERF